jgi:N4-gp56 family major capsid protein
MAGQVWATNSLGGYMYSDQLSDILRRALQPAVKFRQFCDAKSAFGKHNGEAFHWNIYSNVATQGGTLVETNTMPETNFTITQGTGTVRERGNSVPYTGKLNDLSFQPIKEVIHNSLKDDAKKAMDIAAHAQFNLTPLRVVPTGGTSTSAVTITTNGTATLTNSVAFGLDHARAIVDLMKERDIPPYVGEDYYALSHPTTYRTFKTAFEGVAQYTETGFQQIKNGEIGRFENMRYVEQTYIPKGGAADTTTFDPATQTADPWNNGLSSWIFFFGDDTVVEGVSCMEEMRGKIPTDFGRSKGIAWYALNGFAIVHTAQAQARIIKWDSAS